MQRLMVLKGCIVSNKDGKTDFTKYLFKNQFFFFLKIEWDIRTNNGYNTCSKSVSKFRSISQLFFSSSFGLVPPNPNLVLFFLLLIYS